MLPDLDVVEPKEPLGLEEKMVRSEELIFFI